MPMHELVGHNQARERLAASFRNGRLPQVILITGPTGIGKQRLGLWLAQLLFCDRPGEEPCGACRPCRLVLELSHPDLHWFVPVARPKVGDPDKQIEEVAELLAEAMAARRTQPFYEAPDGMASHPMASARLLLRRAMLTPVEAARKVFLLGEADRLVPQESSPDAANALLKLLEEPPADTWIILTTTEPEQVLPTIRSRAVPLRVSQLPPGQGNRFQRRDDERAEGEARALLESVKTGRGARFERSLKQAPWSARGGFTELLDALAAELGEQARKSAALGAEATLRLTRAIERVQIARTEAQGNGNPQLILATLTRELAEVL